jgi:hypothetical protein
MVKKTHKNNQKKHISLLMKVIFFPPTNFCSQTAKKHFSSTSNPNKNSTSTKQQDLHQIRSIFYAPILRNHFSQPPRRRW